jgi:DNA polymerase III alpha subunit
VNRESLIANLPAAMKYAKVSQAAIRAGQGGLFDTAAEPLPVPAMIEVEPAPALERMRRQHKVLGAFVGEHPVQTLKPATLARRTHTCRERHRMLDSPEGVLAVVFVRELKPRGRITFLTVEDETGELEVLCFHEAFERNQWAIQPGMLTALQLEPRHDPSHGSSMLLLRAHKLGQMDGFEPSTFKKR